MIKPLKIVPRSVLLAAACGFVAGVVWLVGARLVTFKSDSVHYHANFALYINGQRDEFNNFTFYEEIQSCNSNLDNPKTRVHMHDHKNSVVHVHDRNVTWGHFMANLGYTLGNDVLKTNKDIYVNDQLGNKLNFILNGKPVNGVANRIIASEDVLLISYGSANSAELTRQYNSIQRDAGKFNQTSDPSACAGSHPTSLGDRLHQAIGLF